MKSKISLLMLFLLLQGCNAGFEENFGKSQIRDALPGVNSADEMKVKPYVKYDTAYLGKKVDYSAKRQSLLAKPVTISAYEPTDLKTVLDVVLAQAGVSYRVNAVMPGGKGGEIDLGAYRVEFTGTFEEFMRYVSALYDVSIALDDNDILSVDAFGIYAIKLDYYGEDRTFEASLNLSNDAATGGGLAGKSEMKFKSSFWEDVQNMADKYITSGVYSIFKDASIITMTARPSEHRALNSVLKKYQDDNNRQFVVTYKIFTLDKEKTKKYGAGLSMSYSDGGTSVMASSPMLDMITGGLTVTGGNDRALSVGAKLDALYSLTGSKILQSGSFVTRNNVPIPLNMTNSQHYVSGRTKSTNSDTGEEDVEIETSEIITGTSFIITPRIMTDGRVEVTSGFTKSSLNSIDIFDTVQLPNVTSTEMFNSTAVNVGSLLMVAKYEATSKSDSSTYQELSYSSKNDDVEGTVVMVVGIDFYRAPLNR